MKGLTLAQFAFICWEYGRKCSLMLLYLAWQFLQSSRRLKQSLRYLYDILWTEVIKTENYETKSQPNQISFVHDDRSDHQTKYSLFLLTLLILEHDRTVLLALLCTLEPNQIFVARGNQLGTTAVLLPAFATRECCSSHCMMCSSSANGQSPLVNKSVQFLQKGRIN